MLKLDVSVIDASECISKTVYLTKPIAVIWRALTDHIEFGQWFGVKLDVPFRVGEVCFGRSTYPGCEHLRWRAITETFDHERLLAFTWWPAPEDPQSEKDDTPGTLVEFLLHATVDGTRFTIRESGFEKIGDAAMRANLMTVRAKGWDIQAANLHRYFRGT